MSNHENQSYNSSPLSSDEIDTSKPYLVSRKSGEIQVWHVDIDEAGNPITDENNKVTLVGQHEEFIDGEVGLPSKTAHPDALKDDVQSLLAYELAMSRPSLTPDQLETVGREELVDLTAELQDALSDLNLRKIEEGSQDVQQKVKSMQQVIGHTDGLLAAAGYNGSSAAKALVPQLQETLYNLRSINSQLGAAAEELTPNVLAIEQRVGEVVNDIKAKAIAQDDEDMGRHLNRIEESSNEMRGNATQIVYGYEQLQSDLMVHGRLDSYVNELATDTYGYETTIAQIRAKFQEMADQGLMMAYRGSASLETSAGDIGRRIRAS